MSGYIVRSGKRSFAFGLIWSMLPSVDSTKSEIKVLAEDHDASEYVTLPFEDSRVLIGLCKKDSVVEKGASRRSAYAAAAVLAAAYEGVLENAIFGVTLPGGGVSLMGFRNGIPLIGFDRVVASRDVDAIVADYLLTLGDAAHTAAFYGHEEIFSGRNAEPFGIEWFGGEDKKKIVKAHLQTVKKPIGLIVTIIVLIAIGVYGLHAYSEYEKEQERKARLIAIDPNELYDKSVKGLLSSAGYPAVEVAWQLAETINHLPMQHGGWRLIEAECEPGVCSLTWDNQDGGTFQSFSTNALPGVSVKNTEYKEGLTAIQTTVEYHVNGKAGVAREVLPSDSDFLMMFGSRAQTLKSIGVPVTIERSSVVGIPSVPAGRPPITENVLKSPVKEGDWSMTGDWIYHGALLNFPLNMTISKLKLAVRDETISMTINGKYYVKK